MIALSEIKEESLRNLPLYPSVPAGFASPAEDHYEERLNINEHLISRPSSTFLHIAENGAMYLSGINREDILIVDSSLKDILEKVVVMRVNGEVHIRRLKSVKQELYLTSDSSMYAPIKINEYEFELLGVVTHSIHCFFPAFTTTRNVHSEDLHALIVKNPLSSFFVRVSGHSMINAGIFDKDILVVDKSIPPSVEQIVIAYVDGGFTVKRLRKNKVNFILFPENEDFEPLELTDEKDSRFWGVVTHSIHKIA